MVMTDPIADLLTRVRNANAARHEVVEVPSSNVKKAIANILLQEGYIKELEEYNDGRCSRPRWLHGHPCTLWWNGSRYRRPIQRDGS